MRIRCRNGSPTGSFGTVSGAFLLIGRKYGKIKSNHAAAEEQTYKLVSEFAGKFIEKHGTTSCKELLGCNLQAPEGQKHFLDNNFKMTKCCKYVHDSAEIVEEMLFKK